MKNLDSLKIASNFLKSQREKKEFTVEEVSIELSLDKKIILDIENRNFDNFKSYLFLKGYMKNYANFLEVNLDLPEVEVKKNKKTIGKKTLDRKLIENKKKITYVTSLLFVAIIIFIFNDRDNSLEEVTISPSLNNKNTNTEKIENNFSNESISAKSDKTYSEVKNTQEIHIDEDKIYLEKSTSNNNLSGLSKDDDISESTNTNSISSANLIDDNFLEITYKGDSWTEIINSKGNIIYFDLVKRGKTIKFNILAPFEILLGDATVVDIKYNNKIISIPYFNPDTNVGKIKVKK